MTPFATLADLAARHPEQLALLAADETTGARDDVRVERALSDASAEMLVYLYARYVPADLAALDPTSVEILRVLAMDIALYRISVAFSRTSETLKQRYDNAIARLKDMGAGKAGLIVERGGGGADAGDGGNGGGPIGPAGVVVAAPERLFSRDRFRSV